MKRTLELEDEILDRVVGGAAFRRNQYVECSTGRFSGIGLVSERQLNADGTYRYTIFSLEEGKIFPNLSEEELQHYKG